MKQSDKQLILTGGVIALAYFGFLRPLLKKLGLAQSQTITNAQTQGSGNPWNENTWRSGPSGRLLITESDVQDRIQKMRNCMGNWIYADNEPCVMAQITSLKTQSQVSYLAYKFRQKTGMGLLDFLIKGESQAPWVGLSDSELDTLLKNVKNKPQYFA